MRRRGNTGFAYDARTGLKVEGRRLKHDFYTGLYTTDPDDQHPQDFPVAPGPDGRNWMPGLPSTDAVGATYAWKDTSWPSNQPTPKMAFWSGTCSVSSGASADAQAIFTLSLPNVTAGLGVISGISPPTMALSDPTADGSSGITIGSDPPDLALSLPSTVATFGVGAVFDTPDMTLSSPAAGASSGATVTPTAPSALTLSTPIAGTNPIAENWGADTWGSQSWGGGA